MASELELEGKCEEDGAWYDCEVSWERVSGKGPALRIHFIGFSEDDDEVWDNLADAEQHLRVRSRPAEDFDCKDLEIGGKVLILQRRAGNVRKYYDAQVHKIFHKSHDVWEPCRCSFQVRWLGSDKAGTFSKLLISSMCIHSPKRVEDHPVVAKAYKAWREQMGEEQEDEEMFEVIIHSSHLSGCVQKDLPLAEVVPKERYKDMRNTGYEEEFEVVIDKPTCETSSDEDAELEPRENGSLVAEEGRSSREGVSGRGKDPVSGGDRVEEAGTICSECGQSDAGSITVMPLDLSSTQAAKGTKPPRLFFCLDCFASSENKTAACFDFDLRIRGLSLSSALQRLSSVLGASGVETLPQSVPPESHVGKSSSMETKARDTGPTVSGQPRGHGEGGERREAKAENGEEEGSHILRNGCGEKRKRMEERLLRDTTTDNMNSEKGRREMETAVSKSIGEKVMPDSPNDVLRVDTLEDREGENAKLEEAENTQAQFHVEIPDRTESDLLPTTAVATPSSDELCPVITPLTGCRTAEQDPTSLATAPLDEDDNVSEGLGLGRVMHNEDESVDVVGSDSDEDESDEDEEGDSGERENKRMKLSDGS